MAHNAPGKHYREGLSMVDVIRMFPDDETAEAWIAKTRWPNGAWCPYCGSVNIQSGAAHKTMPYRCRDCRKRFSVKTGTVMQSSKLGCQVWVLASYLLTTGLKGQASMKLHRDLGVTQKTAWHLAHRIRETWKREHGLFSGPTEADETYMGGLRKNMSKARRNELKGRGTVGKAIIAGVKDRKTGKISATVVEAADAKTLQAFIQGRVAEGATVYTDEASAYKGMPFEHEAVNHSVGEYVRGMAHTNGIESFWSMLKRAHKGTYHKMSHKHLDRYVKEFAGRHGIRERDTIDQMHTIVAGMAGKRLKYSNLIADNGLTSGART